MVLMLKHLSYAVGHTSPYRTLARQGGERSGPCRNVRMTELCEVKEEYRDHPAQSMESGRCACIIFGPTGAMRVLP